MRIAGRLLGLSVDHVVETMRPLVIEPLGPGEPASPACVLGVARIRGEPIRVIDAARLLGLSSAAAPQRFVIVRAGDTRLALQVDVVVDIRDVREPGTGAPIEPAVPVAGLGPVLREARWIDEP
jgi:purine-binding chemotaxis protein CheW